VTLEVQPTFADLGEPLSQVTFCVVDLETTGAGQEAAITEIGAVKVRSGEVLGEFQSLVNPEAHIPASITVLTGISDSLVADAPTLEQVFPAFLAFSEGCVLVAHNARFDVGFLKRAAEQLGYEWPRPDVVDTVALARQALLRDEVPNVRLGTLAAHFHTPVTPNHRALDDARATVDVLHGLLERVGSLGVFTLEELQEFTHRVSPARRAKRALANGLPHAPGVYSFVAELAGRSGPQRQVLYVGKSRDLAARVRSYFTAAETRSRMDEMVRIATRVESTITRTDLEAQILELRMIAAHSPRYNRRSRFPEKYVWLKLTAEPFPRLSMVRKVPPGKGECFGPFRNAQAAEQAMLAIYDAFGLRQCKARLSLSKASPGCALAEMGRCPAPCQLRISAADYSASCAAVRAALAGDVRPVLLAAKPRLDALATQQRFEEAAEIVARLEAFSAAMLRHHRLQSLAGCAEIVAAYPSGSGWEIHVIRFGRLAAAAYVRPGESALEVAASAQAGADSTLEANPPLVEEVTLIADWLERPGVRLICVEGDWSWPLHAGVGSLAEVLG
jgi:DNA polymerase-3 subunit epsilon